MNNIISKLSPDELALHIKGCVQNKRESQKKIYSSFYRYAMAVCDYYAASYEDAVEILNDGFLKIFKQIKNFSPDYTYEIAPFSIWLLQIMMHTATNHYKNNNKCNVVSLPGDGVCYSPALP
jgi:RNA polymerase sigma-70 factor, ECF subfamily